jgi:hypothetical protein
MVAYEPQTGSRNLGRDISTMDTEVHGVRVFDTWSDDDLHDLDMSLDQVDFPRPLPAPTPAPARRQGGGFVRSIVMMMVGGVLGMGVVGAGLLALLVVGGIAAAGVLVYTVPMVDVVMPGEAPRATLPRTGEEADADLVVMPDPGFRGKPSDPPKKK